jgi:Phage gp6-like head-tail connector protein
VLRPGLETDRGSLELVTAPVSEPVSLDEAKLHCRIEQTADDDYVTSLIEGAREFVERVTRRALITQSWRLIFDAWPGMRRGDGYGAASLDQWWDGTRDGPIGMLGSPEVSIRKAPFQSLTSVVILNEDGSTALTWDPSNYYVSTENGFGRLVKRVGQIWPLITPPVRQRGGIVVTFLAGYGDDPMDVPMALRQAIKDIVLHWYETREAVGETSRWHPPMKTAQILQQYTVGR